MKTRLLETSAYFKLEHNTACLHGAFGQNNVSALTLMTLDKISLKPVPSWKIQFCETKRFAPCGHCVICISKMWGV